MPEVRQLAELLIREQNLADRDLGHARVERAATAGRLQQPAGVLEQRGVGLNRSNRDKVCGVRMLSRPGRQSQIAR